MKSGFSIAEIVAHFTYHATLTTLQISDIIGYLGPQTIFTGYDLVNAFFLTSSSSNEPINFNTSPPISVNSSPPITVNSSSSHTVNLSSSSEENFNYEIAPPTELPMPTDAESEDEEEATSSTSPVKHKTT